VAPLLERLPPDAVRDGLASADSVSASVADALWDEVGGDARLGLPLELARAVRPSTYGLLTYLVATCETVGASLRCLVQHYDVLSTAASYSLDAGVALTCRVHGDAVSPGRQVFGTAVVAGFLGAEVPGMPAPREVDLKVGDPGPVWRRRYETFFGAPVRFGAQHNRIVYHRAALSGRLRGADPVLGELLVDQARRRALPAAGWSQRVREVLDVAADLPTIANTLGVAPRTLRRRLAGEATTFQALLDERRRTRAEALLDEGAPVVDVAAEVGFSDPAAFRRAFRRWTGLTPAAHRRAVSRARSP